MPAAKELLEDGLYSKVHNLLRCRFVLRFCVLSCMRTFALSVKGSSSPFSPRVLEPADTALEFVLDNAGPQLLDHSRVVVAVRQVVVQC
jgi:hypothetical protein